MTACYGYSISHHTIAISIEFIDIEGRGSHGWADSPWTIEDGAPKYCTLGPNDHICWTGS